jgi:inorganic pyrophosphatase
VGQIRSMVNMPAGRGIPIQGMKKKAKSALTAPTKLQAVSSEDRNVVQVIVETPKGNRNKFGYDPQLGVFKLKKVLPEGMVFPYDFGFVPSTKAEDGDPADVVILMDEPAYPGCLLDCRIVGALLMEETREGETVRNDRFIAVSLQTHKHSDIRDISDLNKNFVKELGSFFEQYHRLDKADYKTIGQKGAQAARKMLEKQKTRRAA